MHDCDAVRSLLPFRRELPADEQAALDRHLAACPDCAAEMAWDAALASTMQAAPTPAGLTTRLNTNLARNRGRWWRRRVWHSAATAALIAVGVGGYVLRPGPPLLLESVAEEQSQRMPGSPQEVVEFFHQRNVVCVAPSATTFNYGQLRDCQLATLAGVQVPQLQFVSGNGLAKVYLVRDRQFRNLNELQDLARAAESNCTVLVLKSAEHPGWTFVIVVIGGPPELFLRVEAPGIASRSEGVVYE